MIEWRSDKITGSIYPKSSKNPDLEFEFKFGELKRRFAIECKYQRSLFQGAFSFESSQLDNYRNFAEDKKTPVYMALGLGGSPGMPDKLFIMPLKFLGNRDKIDYDQLVQFHKDPGRVKFFYDLETSDLRAYNESFKK